MHDNIKALIDRRKFLKRLKSLAKSKTLKIVLHESPDFMKDEHSGDNAETMILPEDLDTSKLLQKVVTKLQDSNQIVDFSEDNIALTGKELVHSTSDEKDKDSNKDFIHSSSIEDANNISVNKIEHQENNPQDKKSNEQTFSFFKCQEVILPSDDEIDNFLSTQCNAHSLSLDHSYFDPFADLDNHNEDPVYVPSKTENCNDSDLNIFQQEGQIVILNNELIQSANKNKTSQKKTQNIDPNVQHCEFSQCTEEVFSTCSKCLCFLCWAHFDNQSTYNDCLNHAQYSKNKSKIKYLKNNCNLMAKSFIIKADTKNRNTKNNSENNRIGTRETIEIIKKQNQTDDEDREQHCEYIGCEKDICSTCDTCSCFLCVDHFTCFGSDNNCDQHKPYITEKVGDGPVLTKGGTLRKRKLYCENLSKRKEKKALLREEKYFMKEPCTRLCRKQCLSSFDNDMRKGIHKIYYNLNWEAQGLFIKALVDVKTVARRKQNTKPKRDFTYNYNFFDKDQKKVEVCKTFFLSTLGYNPKNDKRVFLAINKSAANQKNLKGSYERKNKIDREAIKEHVMKYEPCISHYRREHAPHRLYLPSDLNITIMHKNFCDSHQDIKISLETYRKIVTCDLNISFVKLGHQECEVCAYFQLHNKDHVQNPTTDCEVCCNYEKHKAKYRCSRTEYQKDVQGSKTSNTDTIFYSVDLQKVIMLPRMEQYKTALFCPRMIVFNETFVPLGSSLSDNLPLAVIWPESISGRNAGDIISAFRAFLLHKRDKKHIILWMDNCSSQNKNWALFSFLVEFVNSDLIAAETITLKYLEPGHTFMSADSYHHQVELSLNRNKKVYDFSDFSESVNQANSGKSSVKEMKVGDFYDYPDLSSQVKLRKREPRCYMADIVSIKAQRSYFNLKFKLNHYDETEETLDFLVNKIIKTRKFPERTAKTSARGLATARKEQILKKLVPLMPQNRRQFWYDLPESEIDEAVEQK